MEVSKHVSIFSEMAYAVPFVRHKIGLNIGKQDLPVNIVNIVNITIPGGKLCPTD